MGNDLITYATGEDAPVSMRDVERQMIRQAVDLSLSLAEPGHMFTNAWLEEALSLDDKPAETAAYEPWLLRRLRLIEGWKAEMLTRHGVHVENRHGKGYLVIAPEQTAHVATKVLRRDFRKVIAQASSKIINARADGLSAAQRQERNDALAYVGKIQLAIEYARPKPPRPGSRAVVRVRAQGAE